MGNKNKQDIKFKEKVGHKKRELQIQPVVQREYNSLIK